MKTCIGYDAGWLLLLLLVVVVVILLVHDYLHTWALSPLACYSKIYN